MSKKIFVGNLPGEVTETDLTENFKQIGEVVSAEVIKDKYSGQSKGFGFVEMATEKEAQEAIQKLNGGELCGRKITVNEARPKPKSSGFGRSDYGGKRRRF